MQALCYWIGYQHSQFWNADLPEGAITAELRRLIKAELPKSLKIECETAYSELALSGPWKKKVRVDLSVFESKGVRVPIAAIEVKRASVDQKLIDDDLIALNILKQTNPCIRAFVLVVGEAYRPAPYATLDGLSPKESIPIRLEKYSPAVMYRVIRVTKAASNFENREVAHYCCLLEIQAGK
jgi:hypothetical protein